MASLRNWGKPWGTWWSPGTRWGVAGLGELGGLGPQVSQVLGELGGLGETWGKLEAILGNWAEFDETWMGLVSLKALGEAGRI